LKRAMRLQSAERMPAEHLVLKRSLKLSHDAPPPDTGCSSTIRDAVDAQADCVVQGQAESQVLSGTTVARMAGVHTLTLRSMACLRRMLLAHPAGSVFPRLQSLRLHLVGIPPSCTSEQHARLGCARVPCSLPRMGAWLLSALHDVRGGPSLSPPLPLSPSPLHAATGRRVLQRSRARQTTKPSPEPLPFSPT
jgi:hypothetical protein